jgi:hypothetical protein
VQKQLHLYSTQFNINKAGIHNFAIDEYFHNKKQRLPIKFRIPYSPEYQKLGINKAIFDLKRNFPPEPVGESLLWPFILVSACLFLIERF